MRRHVSRRGPAPRRTPSRAARENRASTTSLGGYPGQHAPFPGPSICHAAAGALARAAVHLRSIHLAAGQGSAADLEAGAKRQKVGTTYLVGTAA
jgi:hypothetical protein